MTRANRISNTGVPSIVVFFLLFVTGYFYAPFWLYRQSARHVQSKKNCELRLIVLCASMLAASYGINLLQFVIPIDQTASYIFSILFIFTGFSFMVSLWVASQRYAVVLSDCSGQHYNELLLVLFTVLYLNEWQNSVASANSNN